MFSPPWFGDIPTTQSDRFFGLQPSQQVEKHTTAEDAWLVIDGLLG